MWRRDSHSTASGKPGVVQNGKGGFGLPACMSILKKDVVADLGLFALVGVVQTSSKLQS